MHQRKFIIPDSEAEKHSGNSLTIPGEAMTVTEILKRFASGTMPKSQKQTYYEEDPETLLETDEITDGNTYDHSFIDDLKESNAAILRNQAILEAERKKQEDQKKSKNSGRSGIEKKEQTEADDD